MNFLKTIESSLKKYKVFSEELKVFRITLFLKLPLNLLNFFFQLSHNFLLKKIGQLINYFIQLKSKRNQKNRYYR